MSKKNLPEKKNDDKIVFSILFGPIGNLIREQVTKTDYDRQVDAIQKMRKNGIEHGHVKLKSTRRGKITTQNGDAGYEQTHEGEYRW